MSREYEFDGKTKEDAVQKACDALGLSEDEMDIAVLSYGSTGIFGLVGVKKAKIRVTVSYSEAAEEAQETKPSEAPTGDGELAEIAERALEKIVSFVADDAKVRAETGSDGVNLKVEGGNSALLIGKHGRTLDALQYIVQKIVQKAGKARLRVTVDVEGYRDRRKASLTQLALRLGDKVKRSGKPATISPMNAYDRRIVHVALKDETGIRTQSMGSGSHRKLVIYPQKKQKQG